MRASGNGSFQLIDSLGEQLPGRLVTSSPINLQLGVDHFRVVVHIKVIILAVHVTFLLEQRNLLVLMSNEQSVELI